MTLPDEPTGESTELLSGHDTVVVNSAGSPWAFVGMLYFGAAIVMASTLLEVPTLEVYRYVICQSHYSGDQDLLKLVKRYDGAVDDRCNIDEISRRVANISGLAGFVENLCAILVSLPLGRLADTYGRKVPAYIATMGYGLAILTMPVVIMQAERWGYQALLAPSLITGIFGAGPVLRTILHSICCDCYTGPARLVAFSCLTTCLGLTRVLAPAIGSSLLKEGLLWPFRVGLAFIVLSLIFLLALPETHKGLPSLKLGRSDLADHESADVAYTRPHEVGQSFRDTVLNNFGAFAMFTRGRNFLVMGPVSFCAMSTSTAPIILLHFLNRRLGWSMVSMGYFLSVHYFPKFTVLIVILPLFTKMMVQRMTSTRFNVVLLQSGLSCFCIAFLGYAMVDSSGMVILPLVLHSIGTTFFVAISAICANLVGASELRTMFAAFSVIEGLGEMLGTPALAALYSSTLTSMIATALFSTLFLDLAQLERQAENAER